jgi:hypothetical protein
MDSSLAPAEIRDRTLKSLARALFFAIKDTDNIPPEVVTATTRIYRLTGLKDLQEHDQLTVTRRTLESGTTISKNDSALDVSKALNGLLGAGVSAAIAGGGFLVASHISDERGPVAGILALAGLAAMTILGSLRVTRSSASSMEETAETTDDSSGSTDQVLDLSPETLEFELQDVMRGMRQQNRPIVFVVDELDKLDATTLAAAWESHPVGVIVSSLKNFFALGNGIFIFIVDAEYFGHLEQESLDDAYSISHTLFTDRIFVQALPYSDTERLIDSFFIADDEVKSSRIYRQFRNYLCWQSRNHVFDLFNCVTAFVEEYEGTKAVIVARTSGDEEGRWREGNLPADWVEAAGLQKALGATYDEVIRPGGTDLFNQNVWMTLTQWAHRLLMEGFLILPKEGLESVIRRLPYESDQDHQDRANTLERLFGKLERFGLIATTETTLTDAETNETVEAVEYALVVNPPYPGQAIAEHTTLTAVENAFLQLAELLVSADAEFRQMLAIEAKNESVVEIDKLRTSVSRTSARSVQPRARVRQGLESADSQLMGLVDQAVTNIVASQATQASLSLAEASGFDSDVSLSADISQEVRAFVTETVTLVPEAMVIFDDNPDQVCLVIPPSVSCAVANRVADQFKEVDASARKRLVAVVRVRVKPQRGVLRNVPDLLRSNRRRTTPSFVRQGADKTTERGSRLTGWSRFDIQPRPWNFREFADSLHELLER